MRRSILAIALIALAAVWAPATASASFPSYGQLDLTYEMATTNFSAPPERREQASYVPCGSNQIPGLSLLAGGGFLEDNTLDPALFNLGQAYFASLYPIDQVDPPGLDSWNEVADNRSSNETIILGESAVCGDVSGLAHRTASEPNPKKARTVAQVSCPGGKHVLGGGGFTDGPFLSQRLVASAPFDSGDPGKTPDDGWRVAADNLSQTGQNVTVHAICAPLEGLSYVEKPFRARKRSRKAAAAACPAGKYVIGGGLTQDGKPGKQALTVSRFDPVGLVSWQVEFDNLGKKRAPGSAFAICHA